MVAEIYYGKMKNNPEEIESPFELLEWRERIRMSAWDFLGCADMYFQSRTQCDWGSYYWKCKKKDLIHFSEKTKIHLSNLERLSDEEEYAVVFIEMP